MKTLNCDICREELEDPIAGRTYWHIKEYDVCEDCKDVLESKLRPILRGHFPYSNEWYQQQFVSLIEKGVDSKRP